MVVELVPLKGGIGSIFYTPEGKDYKSISGIFPANWGIFFCHQAHLLGEPETTIEFFWLWMCCFLFFKGHF